ncbi:hypothetical protein M5689_002995 [Euphorbia peplus]|nr:hypothetical protein M5689_002995 [Euphorbia peplus]
MKACEMYFIVGLELGAAANKQEKAIVATKMISSVIFALVGQASRGSSISFSIMLCDGEGDEKNDINSPGCLPINTSNATTPKL